MEDVVLLKILIEAQIREILVSTRDDYALAAREVKDYLVSCNALKEIKIKNDGAVSYKSMVFFEDDYSEYDDMDCMRGKAFKL